MLMEVKTVERLIVHYLWILDDVSGAREWIELHGLLMKEEKRLCQEVRRWLDGVKESGRRVF